MAKRKKRSRKAIEQAKAGAAAMARLTHKRKTTFENRKKEAARRACRGKIQAEE